MLRDADQRINAMTSTVSRFIIGDEACLTGAARRRRGAYKLICQRHTHQGNIKT